jgi:putative DNA primase/helicase
MSAVVTNIKPRKAKAQGALPLIEVKAGELPVMMDAAARALGASRTVYDKGRVLVSLNPDTGASCPMTPAVCRVEMARAADWFKKTTTAKAVFDESVDPPHVVAQALVERQDWPQIPKLKTVTDHPLWLAQGVALAPGYDPQSQIYGRFKGFPSVNADATKEEAEEALLKLRDVIKTFPWSELHDEAAALATMLASVSRPAMKKAPLILVSAPAPGSGKAILGKALARFAQEKDVTSGVLPVDDEEIEKRLIASLLESPSVMFFEEIGDGKAGQEIDSASLRNLATAEVMEGRLLGHSKKALVSTCTNVIITANNAIAGADSARRILEIRLDPKCETPAARVFKGPMPDAIVLTRRRELVAAVMTVQAAFLHAGCPGLDDLTRVSDFDDWHKWCRGPIHWLMGLDPATRLVKAQKTDPRAGEVASVLDAVFTLKGPTPWKAADLLKMDGGVYPALEDAMGLRPGKEPSARMVGRWLQGARDRIAGGYVLHEHSHAQGSITWKVVRST